VKILFTCIVTLYFIGLSAIPCSDIHAGNKEISITYQDAQEHHEEHHDICPPFCHCNCCSVSAENIFSKAPSNIGFNITEFNNKDFSQYYSSYFFNIWQPPKVS
jgi:hypothetical protein